MTKIKEFINVEILIKMALSFLWTQDQSKIPDIPSAKYKNKKMYSNVQKHCHYNLIFSGFEL